jgi:hypothetical protein
MELDLILNKIGSKFFVKMSIFKIQKISLKIKLKVPLIFLINIKSNYWNWSFLLKQGSVSHCGLAIYIKKYLNAKGKLWKLKYVTMQKYNLQKIL